MRNIILIGSLIAVMFGFSGCGGTVGPKLTSSTGEQYRINKVGNEFVFDASRSEKSNVQKNGEKIHNAAIKRSNLKFQLVSAAKYTKNMGYNYFVVTNVNISNLNGFPISNYSELARYITLSERKSRFATNGTARDSDALINNGTYPEMLLRFIPISNAVANSGAISVWKVSDFVR